MLATSVVAGLAAAVLPSVSPASFRPAPCSRARKWSLIGTSGYGSRSRIRLMMNRWYGSLKNAGLFTNNTTVGGATSVCVT